MAMESNGKSPVLPAELPLITIGITCYNAAGTIRRAVLSALEQDWPNKQVIIVDDASTDDSIGVLEDLGEQFQKIVLIRHERNLGYASALNTIVHKAGGEFIAIFDDDDYSLPDRLRSQWSRIANYERVQHCNLVLCYSNREVVKAGTRRYIAGAIGRRAPEPSGTVVADYLFGYVRDRRLVWGVFGSCTLMARRETFLTLGPLDESFKRCAEWDLAIRAAFKGAHFIAVDKPLVTQYKTHGIDKDGSISLTHSLRLRDKNRNYLERRRFYRASRAMARSNFYGGNGMLLRSWTYALLACVLSPLFLRERLVSVLFRGNWRST